MIPSCIAVKKLQIINPTTGLDTDVILKLRKELEIMKRLKHQNVVNYYGCEMLGHEFCIYLEYMAHGSLKSVYS
jgi:mitogen-activated protein kinase kinase kinase